MKKAFDQNVSRAKPRLRFGGGVDAAVTEEVPPSLLASELAPTAPVTVAAELTSSAEFAEDALTVQVQTRAQRVRQPRRSAAAMFEDALREGVQEAKRENAPAPVPVVAKKAEVVEAVQPPPEVRRERLKERLKAVRENPRPEPLPASSAEAGVLAVERIASLQLELGKVKALNLALTQDLEAARRQSERATEEARLRIDEAQRLSREMEGRAKLLTDLERELSSLEGERDEALLSLQESRGALESAAKHAELLKADISSRDQSLQDSLVEEERLAGELEQAQAEVEGLRKGVDALTHERDTLARQVADLTHERAELLEARKALESVHRALSQAVAR